MFKKTLNEGMNHEQTQPAFTCSYSTIETPEQCAKSVRS